VGVVTGGEQRWQIVRGRPLPGEWISITHDCLDLGRHVDPILVGGIDQLGSGDYRVSGRRCDGTAIEVLVDKFGREVDYLSGLRVAGPGTLLGVVLPSDVSCRVCAWPTSMIESTATPQGQPRRLLAECCPQCGRRDEATS